MRSSLTLSLSPIVGETLDDDAVLGDPLDEFERTRANRVQAKILAGRLRRFRRHHRSGVKGKLGGQWRKRRRQQDLCCTFVNHLDAGDRTDVAPAR